MGDASHQLRAVFAAFFEMSPTAPDPARQYEINAPDVVAETFDEDVVILNLADGRYFGLAGCANAIWQLLQDGHTPAAILASVLTVRPELTYPSLEFIEHIFKYKLIRPRAESIEIASFPADLTWSEGAPAVEVFDDLAEMIYGDPIHDVDEQVGWPTPRTEQ
jgi:Coenzyme PQQ synthesis protein D (PqqD)